MRDMKRILLSIVLLLALAAPTARAAFSDLPETHEHFAAVQWLNARQVISGYEDGTFQPDREVNRAEALKIVLLGSEVAVESTVSAEAVALFPDVKPSDWFYPYVAKAIEAGIVSGYPDGTFRPERSVNMAELLKMLYLAQGVQPANVTASPYDDVKAEAWFAAYVADAKAKHFIQAYGDGILHPDRPLTRERVAEVVYRMAYIEAFELVEFPIALNWPLFQHPTSSVAFKLPFGWQRVTGEDGTIVLWRQDTEGGQTGRDRTTPNSGVVTVTVDLNPSGLSKAAYFEKARLGFGAYGTVTESNTFAADDTPVLLMEFDGLYERMRDMVVSLPGGMFVTVQATWGRGRLTEQLADTVRAIQSTVQYAEPANPLMTPAQAVIEARAKVQVEKAGGGVLDLFADRELIETDTIGVGTGPVDYFYSVWANVTLKYERSFDILLDVQEGRTTAF